MEPTGFSLDLVSESTLLQPWFAAAPASVLLQVIAVLRLRGGLRSLAVILGVVTGAMLSLVVAAYNLDPGNLWELLLRLSMPAVFVLTVGMLLIGLILGSAQAHRRSYA